MEGSYNLRKRFVVDDFRVIVACINAHAHIVVGHVCKMAAEGEGSAHSSSWNPVESGTSSTCPSDHEGAESSAQSLLQRLRAPQPSDLQSCQVSRICGRSPGFWVFRRITPELPLRHFDLPNLHGISTTL